MSQELNIAVPKKGGALVAWLVILTTVSFVVFGRGLLGAEHETATQPVAESQLEVSLASLQLRALVGGSVIQPGEKVGEQLQALPRGGPQQRLRLAVVAGEVAGPDAALTELAEVDDAVGLDQQVLGILQRLYKDLKHAQRNPPTVSATDRRLLHDQLGWFGDLALHPAGAHAADDGQRAELLGEAVTLLHVLVGVAMGLLGLASLGVVGLPIFVGLARKRGLQVGLSCGACRHAGVYAETFALWLVSYLGLTVVASIYLDALSMPLCAAAAMLVSLLVVAWPVVRGVPWSTVAHDIGWTPGRANPGAELAAGVVCYILNLPIVLLGFAVTLGLVVLQNHLLASAGGTGEGSHLPAHPIVSLLQSATLPDFLAILFLGSICAPILEETMFRGVLYRHLRELTCRLGAWPSALLTTLIVCFLFAVVHPQGLVAVPVLMSLAFGFCLAREWRGTLLPCIFAHGMNNAVVLGLATYFLNQ